jgi:hypothetical protein
MGCVTATSPILRKRLPLATMWKFTHVSALRGRRIHGGSIKTRSNVARSCADSSARGCFKMWDKLLEGRTVHPRHMRRISAPPDHGRLSEPGPPSETSGATDRDGPTRDRIVRFGIATCIGELLRSSYADLVREPLPERFTKALPRLAEPADEAEGGSDDLDRSSAPRGSLLSLQPRRSA